MEKIKIVIKPFYSLLIMIGCVILVINVFFSATNSGGLKIFETSGSIFQPMLGSDEVKNEGLNYLESLESGYVPIVKYSSGVQRVGESVVFKSLMTVRKENGTNVSGSVEDDFALYLMDIKSQAGESVLETLSSEEIAELEEIPASFVYDKEQDKLYFFGSGIYIVYVKIYGSSGGLETYEFQLPVEAM